MLAELAVGKGRAVIGDADGVDGVSSVYVALAAEDLFAFFWAVFSWFGSHFHGNLQFV